MLCQFLLSIIVSCLRIWTWNGDGPREYGNFVVFRVILQIIFLDAKEAEQNLQSLTYSFFCCALNANSCLIIWSYILGHWHFSSFVYDMWHLLKSRVRLEVGLIGWEATNHFLSSLSSSLQVFFPSPLLQISSVL